MFINYFLQQSIKSQRKYSLAAFIGVIAGVISALVKFGAEVPFPPRTPDRLTPPYVFLQDFGINVDSLVYTYSGNTINYGNILVHIAFSVIFAVLYCVISERFPKIKLWQGIAVGIILGVGVHVITFPLMGLTPSALALPFEEYFSEFLGHIFWFWSIELIRRDLRNRITGMPDPIIVPKVA